MEERTHNNPEIESWLMIGGELHIEWNWAIEQFTNYRHEIMLVKNGVPYSELGIGQSRAASMPGIIQMEGNEAQVISDPSLLRDAAATPAGSFAHLQLQGVMRSRDGASSRGIQSLISDIHAANANPNIEGILLEANTGGGESTAGNMLFSALKDSKKAVVVFAHMLASAGIKGTLPADEIIMAGQGAQAGSIGTFITLDRYFASWYQRNYQDIYADKSTNKNKDFRSFLEGDLEPIRKNLNKSNDYFLSEVKKYRPLKGDIAHTLSGAMFFANAAKRRGLADGIGSFNYAVKRLQANVAMRKSN